MEVQEWHEEVSEWYTEVSERGKGVQRGRGEAEPEYCRERGNLRPAPRGSVACWGELVSSPPSYLSYRRAMGHLVR